MMNQSSSPYNFPRLPIEVWEDVIDRLAGNSDLVQGNMTKLTRRRLVACSLVCRSWAPRCRYHLYRQLFLRSEADLEVVVLRLTEVPGLATRVALISIDCTSGSKQNWVALLPLRLHAVGMHTLPMLVMLRFDFTVARHRGFYEMYRQLPIKRLVLGVDVIYSRYSQITQLATAVRAESVSVRSLVTHLTNPGRICMGTAPKALELTMTWRELCETSQHWDFLRLGLRNVRFTIQGDQDSSRETVFGKSIPTWERIASLFWNMRSITKALDNLEVTVWLVGEKRHDIAARQFELHTDCATGPSLCKTTLRMCEDQGVRVATYILKGIASSLCQLHSIVLPYLPLDSLKYLKEIDDCLVNPAFDLLQECDIIDWEEQSGEQHDKCRHERYKEWMPQTAQRGLLHCECRQNARIETADLT
ncbi:hypothetical protein BXZ70DRAFT_274747 [Cristinia sonorae]|uniref:F-box domain-containing protein n=1 Tax=Cristinia sonorae TaxID=1940300 RepID=A0A8K0XUJ2_9AGAR|nr:hypothetical protein BXZ70DRAFT_274747 [Cristinia sonorae]